jgi:hypothetical protein
LILRLKNDQRIVLVLWAVACCVAAVFIPQYDFAFDGVKIWFYLCLLMLVLLLGGASLLRSMHHRDGHR